ncbi:unnamed protein product [Penicillium pancosmium]
MLGHNLKTALAVTLLAGSAAAIDLNIKDEQSIKDAAKTAASGAMTFYSDRSSDIPGYVAGGWWKGAALFNVMIEYWSLTGDDSNNDAVSEGMYWQRGADDNYMPVNVSSFIGNDDQLPWGLAAMTAAELDYPQKSSMPSWETLAENVWNTVSSRWDTDNCDGGLRWQIFPYQQGYALKNSVSNGALFALSARLARFTNNQTYADWAEKIWDWSAKTPLLNEKTWNIADTTSCNKNCSDHGDWQWSFNYGLYMSGAAFMYNQTDGKSKWKNGLTGLLNTSQDFFPEKYGGKILSEITCEPLEICDTSQILFKGLFAQDLAVIAQVAPYTESDILPLLQGSATAAAKSCTGGKNDDLCGIKWYTSKYDGSEGLEQQISATALFVANLINFDQKALVTESTAKNSNSSSTTGGSPSSTSNGTTFVTETASASGGKGDGNGAGMLASGPVVLISAMVMGIMSIL